MSTVTRRLRIVALAVLLLLSAGCSPLSVTGSGTMSITAYFPDTAGLFEGNDVGILGVSVGKVTKIEPEGSQVKVTMSVDDDYDVPVDAGAVIVARSVATDRYVELTPVYHDGAKMQDGAEIPLDRTRTPVEFDQVLAALNTFATGIAGSKRSTDAIRRIIDSGSAALDGNGQLLNGTIKSLSGAIGSIDDKRGDITATVRSLDTLITTIATNQQTTRTFIAQVSKVSRQLNDERFNFRTALRSLDSAVTTVAKFAADHRQEIVHSIGSTSTLLQTMVSRQRQLTSILEVFPLALQNLALAGRGKRLPVRLPPFSILPIAGPLTQLCQTLPGPLCDLISGTDPTPNPKEKGR